MFKQIKNWIIKKLGGYTSEEYKEVESKAAIGEKSAEDYKKLSSQTTETFGALRKAILEMAAEKSDLEKSIKTVQVTTPLGGAMKYTGENVIKESRNQVYYQLGKAVYPFAVHSISECEYICSVKVQECANE